MSPQITHLNGSATEKVHEIPAPLCKSTHLCGASVLLEERLSLAVATGLHLAQLLDCPSVEVCRPEWCVHGCKYGGEVCDRVVGGTRLRRPRCELDKLICYTWKAKCPTQLVLVSTPFNFASLSNLRHTLTSRRRCAHPGFGAHRSS